MVTQLDNLCIDHWVFVLIIYIVSSPRDQKETECSNAQEGDPKREEFLNFPFRKCVSEGRLPKWMNLWKSSKQYLIPLNFGEKIYCRFWGPVDVFAHQICPPYKGTRQIYINTKEAQLYKLFFLYNIQIYKLLRKDYDEIRENLRALSWNTPESGTL